MKKIYFILLAVLAIASCKKPEPDTPTPPATTGNVTVIATAPSAWAAGQTIGLAGASANKISPALGSDDIAQDGKASFLFSDIAKGQYVAYYPYNAANKVGSVAFTVASSQDGSEPVIPLLSSNDGGFGAVEVVDFDSPVEVELAPVAAVLNISVYGGASDEVMRSITVKAAGESKLSGTVTCSNKGEVSVTGSATVAASGLQYSLSAQTAPETGVKFLVLPVEIEANTAGTVTYTVSTANANYVFNSKEAFSVSAGSVKNIELNLAQADAVTVNCTVNATAPSAWTAGQTIGLAGSAAKIESAALAATDISGEGNKKGAFLFSSVDAGNYLAFWPYSAGNNDGTVTFSVASAQNGTFTMPLMSADNGSYAAVAIAGGNTSVDVGMKAVGAVLNFKVYGGPAGETMSSIKVTAESSDNLAGTVTYGSDASLAGTTNTSATVTVSANQSVALEAAPSDGVKAMVLPVNIAAGETGTVTYTVTTGKGEYIFKSTAACTWEAGEEYVISLDLGEADEDPYDPYDWREYVDVTGVHIPAYSSFLPAAPAGNDKRLEVDALYPAAYNADSDREKLAASDMKLSVAGLFSTFNTAAGLNLSTSTDTDLADLVKIVLSSCRAACPDEYPSSVAASGWATALLLAQLNYDKQENILKAGLRIGESAVIAGQTTYSAAQTGQIVASMLMSSLRSNAAFAEKLAGITASKTSGYPADKDAFANFLPAPPSDEITNLYDKERFEWGVSQRETERGTQAVKDKEYSGTYMRRQYYAPVIGYQVTGTNSEHFYNLVQEVFSDKSATNAKEGHDRTRPYDFFAGGSNIVDMPADAGKSYPSGHTTAGFLTGLVYSEIDPANADAYYRKGYDYGISRVIVGVHYQSDVDAGILTAAAALSRYHASEAFISALKQAKKDYIIVKDRQTDNKNPNIDIGYGDNDEEFK